MLILTQDKNCILNVEKSNTIFITGTDDIWYIQIEFSHEHPNYILGTYNSQERAKDILSLIMSKAESKGFAFRMPNE